MAWLPIARTPIQYEKTDGNPANGYYLKFYLAGTTTPTAMATDTTGATQLAKCKLNERGFPISNASDETSIFIPHVNSAFSAFKYVIYQNSSDADANNFANAIVNISSVGSVVDVLSYLSEYVNTVDTYADISAALTGMEIGQQFILAGHTESGKGGGVFNVVSSSGLTADNGLIVINGAKAAKRVIDHYVTPQMFGSINGANNATPIQDAVNSGHTVNFPKDVYILGAEGAPFFLTFTNDNQLINLNGSELRFLGKGGMYIKANGITIDAQGGILTNYIGYAEVAINTVSGSDTIIVTDSSHLTVGQSVASSWGDTGGSGVFPLGGPIAPSRTISSIVGNTVKVTPAMQSGDYLAQQVIFGDFTFAAFIQPYKDNFRLINCTLNRISGYYCHTPNAVGDPALVPGGRVYFDNCRFESNGTDQFLIKHNQKFYFINCYAAQMWDTGKTGIYIADTASLYIQDCDELHLGNFDASITVSNIWDSAIDGGEIVISNSSIYGVTRFTSPPAASQGQNNLSFIELSFSGIFDRISLTNSRCVGYLRHNITSTAEVRETSAVVSAIRIDNCLIDGSAFYFLYSGSGNGINCPNVRISNTSYYQSFGYVFHFVAGISGAVCNFTPHFDNCFFQFAGSSGGFAEFGSTAHVADSQFNLIGVPYTHHQSVAKLDNCLFSGSPVINITPTYSTEFYGELSRATIDSPNFPTNLSSVFTALGGSSLDGAKIATAKSQNGSVYYNIFKQGTTIRASAEFHISNNTYFLRGDDYYIPIGSTIKDMYLGTTKIVTFNLFSSLTATALTGATSVVVSNASGVAVGDLINIVLDNGLVDTKTVSGAYAGGLTIPLTTGLSAQATSGKYVNFFRPV